MLMLASPKRMTLDCPLAHARTTDFFPPWTSPLGLLHGRLRGFIKLLLAVHPITEPPPDAVESAELNLVDHLSLLKCGDAEENKRHEYEQEQRDRRSKERDNISRPR